MLVKDIKLNKVKLKYPIIINSSIYEYDINPFKGLNKTNVIALARKLFVNNSINIETLSYEYFIKAYSYCLKHFSYFHIELLFNYLEKIEKFSNNFNLILNKLHRKITTSFDYKTINPNCSLVLLLNDSKTILEIINIRKSLKDILHIKDYELNESLVNLQDSVIIISERLNTLIIDNIVINILTASLSDDTTNYKTQNYLHVVNLLNKNQDLLSKFAKVIKFSSSNLQMHITAEIS